MGALASAYRHTEDIRIFAMTLNRVCVNCAEHVLPERIARQ
jgi:hypothetical protein